MKNMISSGILSIVSLTLFTNCEKKESPELSSEEKSKSSEISNYTSQEKDLLKDLNAMFVSKDVSNMMKRQYKDKDKDFGEMNIKIQEKYLEDLIKNGSGSFDLERVEPAETERLGHNGEVYQWSLPLKWKLIIHDAKSKYTSYLIHLSDHQNQLVIIRSIAPGN